MARPFSFDDAILAPGTARLLAAAPPPPGARVLDVAAGSGVLARRVGGTAGRVVSLDVGRNILKKARALYDGAAPAAWVRGDAQRLPFPDGAFDAVYCHQGLQFCADPRRAARELLRVRAPGGLAAAMVWAPLDRCRPYDVLARAVAAVCGEPAADYVRAPFRLGRPDALADLFGGDPGLAIAPVEVQVAIPDPAAFARGFVSYLPEQLLDGATPDEVAGPVAARVGRDLAPAAAGVMEAWIAAVRS